MSQEKITMASPLAEIAKIIATNYLQRPFPKDLSPNGLLDYTSIRKQKINPDDVRVIHGYSNACRVAALIPQLLKLYEKHVDELVPELQHEIKAITEADIKEFMIVALMRSTGRTRDGGHGDEFAAQGKKECLSYLEYLGMEDAAKREALASMIVDCEGGKKGKLTLGAILLADATLMETFRDGLSYEDKNIYLDYFPFFHMLASPKKLDTINEFINFCTIHAQVIHKHQGFLFSALKCKHSPNEKLQIAWPVDKYSDELHKKGEEQIKKLDYSINCYEQCLQDVNKAFDVFWEATKYKMYSEIPALLSLTAQLQQKIPPNSSLAAFIQELIQFFEPIVARGEIVTDGNNVFEISWNSILQAWPYYFNGKEYEQIQPLDLREIFSQKLARKEGEDPLNFIERVLDYFEPKIGRAFFVDDNGKVTPLKWSIIIYIIEHTLQDTNIKKVRERIYKTVINSIKKVKEEESVSSVIIEFTSSQAALQAVKYLTFFAQKYNIKENVQYTTGHSMLQLSKEFWGKCQYPKRELPEHIGNRYVIKVLCADSKRNTVDFFLDGILPIGDRLYQDIRPKLKGKFTIYTHGIVKRKNKKQMYPVVVKNNYSQIQSTTFLNEAAITTTAYDIENKDSPKVAVLIAEDDILINRLLTKRAAGNTVKRKLDASSTSEATEKANSLKGNLFGASHSEVEKFKKEIRNDLELNEALTRLRWNPATSKGEFEKEVHHQVLR
jgi:predicted CopG family antitoxin